MGTPEHLQFTTSDRGFKYFPKVGPLRPVDCGVEISESSFASHPSIRLNVVPDVNGVGAHLSIEQAQQLAQQLTYLVHHHYQVEPGIPEEQSGSDGPSLEETAGCLLWLLRRAGDEWGPLGVLVLRRFLLIVTPKSFCRGRR